MQYKQRLYNYQKQNRSNVLTPRQVRRLLKKLKLHRGQI